MADPPGEHFGYTW